MADYLPIPMTDKEPLGTVLNTLRMKILGDNLFEGSNLRQFSNRVYGGQVFAQAVVAAGATFGDDVNERLIHSINKMVTCQNYVSLFYCQITSFPSDGGIS